MRAVDCCCYALRKTRCWNGPKSDCVSDMLVRGDVVVFFSVGVRLLEGLGGKVPKANVVLRGSKITFSDVILETGGARDASSASLAGASRYPIHSGNGPSPPNRSALLAK